MKANFVTLLLLFASINAFAQVKNTSLIEENPNWKSYKEFAETTFSNGEIKEKREYTLKDGIISFYRVYDKGGDVQREVEVEYDAQGNLYQERKMFDKSTGITREIIFQNEFTYDDKNNLIDDGENSYSKFNRGLPQVVTSREYSEEREQGFRRILAYNQNGTIKLSKTTLFEGEDRKMIIITYKYDDCNNLIETVQKTTIQAKPQPKKRRKRNKNAAPPRRPEFERKYYAYEYEGDTCLWTKKYEVINDEKILLKEREF